MRNSSDWFNATKYREGQYVVSTTRKVAAVDMEKQGKPGYMVDSYQLDRGQYRVLYTPLDLVAYHTEDSVTSLLDLGKYTLVKVDSKRWCELHADKACRSVRYEVTGGDNTKIELTVKDNLVSFDLVKTITYDSNGKTFADIKAEAEEYIQAWDALKKVKEYFVQHGYMVK